jgi:hypothetical protein
VYINNVIYVSLSYADLTYDFVDLSV